MFKRELSKISSMLSCYYFILALCNSGMYFAATVFVPSAFTMLFLLLTTIFTLNDKIKVIIKLF